MKQPLVIPCDISQLRADVERLWPQAAHARGVRDVANTAAKVDADGYLFDGSPFFRNDPSVMRLALEELARALEDIGYHVEREGDSPRVLGWAATRCRRGEHLAVWYSPTVRWVCRIADLDAWHPNRAARGEHLLDERLRRDATVAPAPNPKLHARGLR